MFVKNGAKIIAAEKFQNEDRWLVLCLWENNSREEYVVWHCDKEMNTSWGHYFKTEKEAREWFTEKVNANILAIS